MGHSWSQPRDTERVARDRHRIVDAAISIVAENA
jgi:hypothetical protein